MKKSRLALVIAVSLFAGWMVYLGATALRHRRPVVVSAAQLLVSEYDLEVDLPAAHANEATVQAVLWSSGDQKPAGRITIANLSRAEGFVGSGAYLILLVHRTGRYELAGLPLDPGFPFKPEPIAPRIYPLTEDVRRQYQRLRFGQ